MFSSLSLDKLALRFLGRNRDLLMSREVLWVSPVEVIFVFDFAVPRE